jgi:hypothetical protein
MEYVQAALIIALCLATLLRVVYWAVHGGAYVRSVGVMFKAASRGEDYYEVVVGGTRLRKVLEVEATLSPLHSEHALRRRIWRMAKRCEPKISRISYAGHVYAYN